MYTLKKQINAVFFGGKVCVSGQYCSNTDSVKGQKMELVGITYVDCGFPLQCLKLGNDNFGSGPDNHENLWHYRDNGWKPDTGKDVSVRCAEEGNICPKSHPYTDSSDKNYCRQGKKDWGTRLKCPNENNCEDCKSTLFHYYVCYYHILKLLQNLFTLRLSRVYRYLSYSKFGIIHPRKRIY